MKNTFYTILFLIVSLYLAAQSSLPRRQAGKKIDSLFTVLKTAKADTTLVNTYNKLCREYRSSNPDTALFFANSALKLAIKANYKKGIAISYNSIGLIHANKSDYDKALIFYFKSLKIKEELGDKYGMAGTYNNIGLVHADKSNYNKAIEFYFKSLKITEGILSKAKEFSEKQDALKRMSTSFNNIGEINRYKGEYDKAIDFYFKSLKIDEELGDKYGIAISYNNIGNIYEKEGAYDKAIEFYFKGLKICEELGDKKGMAMFYNNIGIIHKNKGDYDKAIEFYFKSLKIKEELGNKSGIAISYNNIGIIHNRKREYDKAIEFYLKSLKIKKEIGDKYGMASSYINIGILFLKQDKPKEAKKQQLQALNIAKEIGAKREMYLAYNSIAQCDSALGNFKGAYEYHKLYTQVHDSVFSKESSDKITEMGAKYEAEKRELTIQKLEKEKLLQNETLARKEAESKKQRILLFSFLTGFIIILVFSVFLYRLFVQKKKANVILAQQKEEISAQRDEIESQRDLVTQQKEHIEHIHEEQTDSIRYAERIQKAVLPDFKKVLNTKYQNPNSKSQVGLELETWSLELESFILFKPKDIVSGDFYYVAQRKNILLIAVADCTGHGVPGAFMSMLGISFLNEIIAKEEIQSASHVLNELRQYVINSLQQKGMVGEQQDGMDIAFIALNIETLELQFAGANNPCYVIAKTLPVIARSETTKQSQIKDCFVPRNDDQGVPRNDEYHLIEIKADKMPVGIYGDMPAFNNNIIQINKGDKIYIFSDGFIDQFGGENNLPAGRHGKKFLSKRFKETLLQIAHLPMTEQYENLNNTFENWKGKVEQIDDVTVMGIRIT